MNGGGASLWRGVIDFWNGTIRYTPAQMRKHYRTMTTDANGRVTLELTQNNSAGGVALFSEIVGINAIGIDGSGNPLQCPLPFVESITGTTKIVLRFVKGRSQGILLGGTVTTLEYVAAGYTVMIEVTGRKA